MKNLLSRGPATRRIITLIAKFSFGESCRIYSSVSTPHAPCVWEVSPLLWWTVSSRWAVSRLMCTGRGAVSSSWGFESSEVFILFFLWKLIKIDFPFSCLSFTRSNLSIFQLFFFPRSLAQAMMCSKFSGSFDLLSFAVSRSYFPSVRFFTSNLTPVWGGGCFS